MLKISVSIYHFPTPNGFCVGTWQHSSVTGALGCPAPYPLRHCHRTPRWQNVTQRTSATAWPLPSARAGGTAGGEGVLRPLGHGRHQLRSRRGCPRPSSPTAARHVARAQPANPPLGTAASPLPWHGGSPPPAVPWCRVASCSHVAGPLLVGAASSHPWRGAPARQVMLELSA